MRRFKPLWLAIMLALLLSLSFGIMGVESQAPTTPTNKEHVLQVSAVPSGVTAKYVAPGGQTTVVACGGEDSQWNCALPVGNFYVEPLPELVWVWEVVEAQSSQAVSIAGIIPFIGWFVMPSGETLPSICVTTKIETAIDAWDFRCVLGISSGKFIADFNTKGFIPNVVDPIPPEPPSLLPTVTPMPNQ